MTLNRLIGLIAIVGAFSACSSSGGSGDGGSDGGIDGNDDGNGNVEAEISFVTETLDSNYAGRHASIDSRGDTVGIAYYQVPPDLTKEVTCPGAANPSDQDAQDLMYIEFANDAWGDPVNIDRTVLVTLGLSFVFAAEANGPRYIGYLGGTLSDNDCSSTDAYVASSNDGATWTPAYYGDGTGANGVEGVGGNWTSVAVDSNDDMFAAYRDVGLGLYEQEGEESADLRFGDGGSTSAANTNNGAGEFSFLLFDTDDEPVILHNNPVASGANGGLIVTRREGSTWSNTKIGEPTVERPGFATDGDGKFGIAYYDTDSRSLYYVESTNLTDWSTPELVDTSTTVHGSFASLAFDSDGNPAVSYYRCGPAGSSTSSCNQSQDGVMFATKRSGRWQTALVDGGSSYRCGNYTSITFNADDEPLIAYQCVAINNLLGGIPVDTLKVARGIWQ